MGWWSRYLAWRQRNVRRVTADADGFAVSNRGTECGTAWRDVSRVTALKRDLITIDLLCLFIESRDGMIEINEEMDGYAGFEAHLIDALALTIDWKLAVLFPPFETNAATIFERRLPA